MQSLCLYFESGRKVELVDSKTLCAFLGVSKPETLFKMAKRGDLPKPIHLNMNLKGKKGRNQVRWDLLLVVQHLGVRDAV